MGFNGFRGIFCNCLNLPSDSNLVKTVGDYPLMVVVGPRAPEEEIKRLRDLNVEVIQLSKMAGYSNRPDPQELLHILAQRNIRHLLVEGGGETIASFLEKELVDRIICYLTPKIIGGRNSPHPVGNLGFQKVKDALHLSNMHVSHSGRDLKITTHLTTWH